METDAAREAAARQLAAETAAAIEEIYATSHRDETPLPQYGPTPPVAQPGRPPTDPAAAAFTVRAIGASAVIATTGGSTALILHTLAHVDTAQLALGAGGTVALMLAVGAVLRRAAGVRTTHHHHYDGATVTQDHRAITSKTAGVWARTDNRQK
jgi:hypothetical protein